MTTTTQTPAQAIRLLMDEVGARKSNARRYPGIKRALRALQITENGDDWHNIMEYLGYHDGKTRAPHAWVLPKPRPKSFRVTLIGWKRRGKSLDDENTDGYNLADYAREAKVELEGHKTARAARDAATRIRHKPDKDGVYPLCEAEPVYDHAM